MNGIYKAQRIGVFVDVQNMYYSAKNLYSSYVNFGAVLREAVKNRNLIRAIAYVIKAEVREEKRFFEALKTEGFEIKAKELQIYESGEKKGDWDVGIAIDAILLADKVDVVCLVSGDGDFVPLVWYLKYSKGVRVELLSFQKTTSLKLRELADRYVDLGRNKRRFLIRIR